MPSDEYFSFDYQQARSKFLEAARRAKAQVSSYAHAEQKAPDGSELVVDVAEIRATEQRNLLVIISSTGLKDSAGPVVRSDFWSNGSMKVCLRL